jgi:hypothetical protein
MLPIRTVIVAALAFTMAPAFAAPVAPEPAPPAQRMAPPDKIAPPMKVPAKPLKPETTGQAPQELAPGKDQNVQIPSSPSEVTKCGGASQQERTLRSTRCP